MRQDSIRTTGPQCGWIRKRGGSASWLIQLLRRAMGAGLSGCGEAPPAAPSRAPGLFLLFRPVFSPSWGYGLGLLFLFGLSSRGGVVGVRGIIFSHPHPASPMDQDHSLEGLADLELKVCDLELDVCTGVAHQG